ncbi:MAG: hypothetical protein U0637_12200 [Phycisphaerales bacterium]
MLHQTMRSAQVWAAALTLAARLSCAPAIAQTDAGLAPPDSTVRQQLEELRRQNELMLRQIDELRRRLDSFGSAAPPPTASPSAGPRPSPQEALDSALARSGAGAAEPAGAPGGGPLLKFGPAALRLVDVSMVVDTAAGWSSEPDQSLQTLQAGGHDPRKRGFTLQAAELALSATVDPHFSAFTNIVYFIDPPSGESAVELEEAFVLSQALPHGLQLKAGQYLTDFGQVNPTHPHAWEWMDQPVVLSRMFGGDGMRAPGARVGWLLPVPWYSQLIVGAQNPNGETMASFVSEAEVGGRPFVDRHVSGPDDLVWSARWEGSTDLTPTTTLKFGVSGVTGPNASGPGERTDIYGADLKLKWRPEENERGWPFVLWQTEVVGRSFGVGAYTDPDNAANDLPGATLHDWGFFTQLLYGFTPGWAAGLRYEYAGGDGESVGGRGADPFRDNRQRLSPLLIWQLSEFSRLRLQYNHDAADHLEGGDADSVYLGLEVLFGAHPAHSF